MIQKELRLKSCYDEYSELIEDNSSFGLSNFIFADNSNLVTSIDA
jgi:hypothetical protein